MEKEALRDIALVVTMIITMLVKDWITKRNEKREALKKAKLEKEKEERGIDEDLSISGKIYDKLTDLLFLYDATRAFIKQFHNGSAFYSGQKIQRQTVSHEKGRPGIERIKPSHDAILIPTEVHNILETMQRTGSQVYYCEDVEGIKQEKPELYQWMNNFNARSVLYVKITDLKTGNTIGLLGLTFNHGRALNEQQIKKIEIHKRQIETIFDKIK